ncbi:type I-C CRISPR-associated protein Cas5c [Nocardia sp. CNY236]|uniref:type I-C CRISPR-associated protein Cas5c n=1 Tax=Nocardia sp. CNY236 TaxID=1169152 RepID=UPI0004145A3D|nr:type I-C CRISPR-associated protein Cas5c [Nocardia sp. CNY236]
MNSTHPYYPHSPLVVEVSGDYACFTRPEMKSERFSYEVITPSAARGILEAIFWKPEFDYIIVKIEVLKPIRWFAIRRNEVKSMVSDDWVRRAIADPGLRYDVEDDRDQRNTVGLRDVAYRIYAQIRLRSHATATEMAYRDQLRRRVDRGACYSQPFLGTREFSARFGKATSAEPISGRRDKDKDLGVMLHSIAYGPDGGETYRWFLARLTDGVLHVPPRGMELPSAGAVKRGRRANAD